MKIKWTLGVFVALTLCFGLVSSALAASYQSNQNGDLVISSEQNAGNIYAAANTVTIDTQILDDLIVSSATLNVQKPVAGSVFALVKDLNVAAPIGRSVRVAGDQLRLNSNVSGDVTAVGRALILAKGAIINGDLHFAGRDLEINGEIFGNVFVAGASTSINGTIHGNIEISGRTIVISDTAMVLGSLKYYSDRDANIAAGVVKGSIDHVPTPKPYGASGMLFGVLTTLLSGAVIILLARYKLERLVNNRAEMLKNLGVGALVLFVAPIAILVLMMTLIAMPLALACLVIYFLLLYLASVTSSIYIGMLILQWLKTKVAEKYAPYLGLLIGVFVTAVVRQLPIIGSIALFVLMVYVIGIMARYDLALWHKLRHEKEL